MKKLVLLVLIVLFGLAANAQDAAVQEQIRVKSDSLSTTFGSAYGGSISTMYNMQGLSKEEFLRGFNSVMQADTANHAYLEGVQIAMDFLKTLNDMEKKQGIRLNRNLFAQAFVAQMTSPVAPTQDELMAANTKLQHDVQELTALVQANDPIVIAGKKYAAEMLAKNDGYVKTESGLVYKMLAAGSGDTFKATDRVRLKYRGTHVDGTVFDESNDTTTLGVSGVVPGFKEALMLMRPGSKMIAVIPGDLAYGKRGAGNGLIKPNETLVFEIETFGVEEVKQVDKAEPAGAVNSDRRQQGTDSNSKKK